MRLQELELKETVRQDEGVERRVRVFLQSSFYLLRGHWQWELTTHAVFCSDVMLSLPGDFSGTRAIFHPDDVAHLKEALSSDSTIPYLEFRIITTYGEVKTLVGSSVLVQEEVPVDFTRQSAEPALRALEQKTENAHLHLLQEINNKTSRFSGTGAWYYNAATLQTWYSDFVYLLHGLPAQSLNAHLHTFHAFVHPEDNAFVAQFMDKAFREKIPLHMDYRIRVGNTEKWVSYKAQWLYSEKGEAVLGGIYQDVTARKEAEKELEQHKSLVQFQRQQALYDEQQVSFGHWQVSLLTRKAIYSDQYYRLFGLKPQSLSPTLTAFLNYIHPEDRERVEAASRQLIHEHNIPDLEYRILRPDGKTRYLQQKAKLIMVGEELLVSGIVQDITVQCMLEKRIGNLNEVVQVKQWLAQQSDEQASLVTWVMDLEENTIDWSESFYKLIGSTRPVSVTVTEKTLFSLVHPHDVKAFRMQWNLAVQQKKGSGFSIRFLVRGNVQYMKLGFEVYQQGGKELLIGTLQNNTAEQVLQQQLAQRVQLAESLSENTFNRVIITDTSNTIQLWNRACEQVYHLKKADVLGQNLFDVLPQLKNEKEIQLLQKAQRGEKLLLEGIASAFGKGYHNLHLIPLYKEGEIWGILHIIQDVTKEVELRNSLNERLRLIESLVQSSVDRIIALDKNLNYLYWNKSAEDYYDLPKEAVLGKNILEVFPRLVNDPSYAEIRRALRGETIHLPVNAEAEAYFETYLIPIKDEKGEVASLLWMAHDLSKEWALQLDQRQAQERIRQGELLLRSTEEVAQVGSYEADLLQNTFRFSDGMYRLFGEEPHSFEPSLKWIDSRSHPDDRAPVKAALDNAIATRQAYSYQRRIYRRDGELRTLEAQGKVVCDAGGSAVKLVGLVQDVTERQQAEAELKESRLFIEQVVNATPGFIMVFNLVTNKFDYVNRSGYKEDENRYHETLLIGYDQILLRAHPDDRQPLHDFVESFRTAEDNEIHSLVYRVVKGDEVIWYRSRGKVFKRDEQNKPTHYISIIQDISREKEAEAEILRLKDEVAQRAEDKYRLLFNSIDEGFYQAEVIFDEAGKVLDILFMEENPAAVRLMGQSFVGKTLKQINPGYENHWFELGGGVARTGKSKRVELYSAPNQKWFNAYVTKMGDGSNRLIAIFFQDFTDAKTLENS